MTDEFIVLSLRTYWDWAEAFYKYGFGGGVASSNTRYVKEVLTEAGCSVKLYQWDTHNLVIRSIKKDGSELIPHERDGFDFGYDNPRGYLPSDIIDLLDEHIPNPKPKWSTPSTM